MPDPGATGRAGTGIGLKPSILDLAAHPERAIEIQLDIRKRMILDRVIETGSIREVAGADAAYGEGLVVSAVVVLSLVEYAERCSAVSFLKDPLPYIPGLFAFREGQGVLEAFQRLPCRPDLALFHGHGYAHPRRCGLASHLGVLLGLPSVGVANHPLVGTAEAPGEERGSVSPLMDGEEVIGMAVRTRERSRPVYVSVGHQTDLEQAVEVVLATTRCSRLPEPLVQADRLARRQARNHGLMGHQ